MSPVTTRGRLRLEDVRFLALEGGGGKGSAYPGALQALKDLGLLRYEGHRVSAHSQVRGFAGASAGAITALALSCGYDPAAIAKILRDVDFSQLFDPPSIYRHPSIYGFGMGPKPTDRVAQRAPANAQVGPCDRISEEEQARSMEYFLKELAAGALQSNILPQAIASSLLLAAGACGLVAVALQEWPMLRRLLPKQVPPPGDLVLQHPAAAYDCLTQDWGIFSGDYFTNAFGRIIFGALEAKEQHRDMKFIRDKDFTSASWMTFVDHEENFGVELGVMATDLASHKSVFFSKRTTPKFPVVGAVRISMGLPLIFKPIVLTPEECRNLIGESYSSATESAVLVDGGLFNNIPLTVIDEIWGQEYEEEEKQQGSEAKPARNSTLGLRLGEDTPAHIDSFPALLKSWLWDTGAFGSGESQIQATLGTDVRTILLDTDGLELLDFAAPSKECEAHLADRARRRVMEYFGFLTPPGRLRNS